MCHNNTLKKINLDEIAMSDAEWKQFSTSLKESINLECLMYVSIFQLCVYSMHNTYIYNI